MISIKNIIKNISNIPGWKSDKKFIIIESDDWGSIRMPSKAAYERLSKIGVQLDAGNSAVYNKYDTLASVKDFEGLFNSLTKFRDYNGVHPIFTAMSLSANPDFQKIRDDNFRNYYFEPFTVTLEKYGISDSIDFWKKGIELGIFIPQFHGREHLNINAWIRALQRKDTFTMAAFNEGFWGFRNAASSHLNFQAAFDLEIFGDISVQEEIIRSGLQIFEDIHGYKALFFVPPNGPFNMSLCSMASKEGIKFISTPKIHHEPQGNHKYKRKFFYLGKRNEFNQIYLIRNCFFEPSLGKIDWVDSCLKDIQVAFKWGKPAIISSHRVNYIGVHDEINRMKGLQELEKLLSSIIANWPDVEFLSSVELGEKIAGLS
jgi:hypothetical protein